MPISSLTQAPPNVEAVQLMEELRACRRCPWLESEMRDNGLPGISPTPYDGDPTSPLWFIGRNPGITEYHMGRPFCGRGGHILDEWFQACGLARAKCFVMNMIACYTFKDRDPSSDEIANCSHFAMQMLWRFRPKFVVTFGVQAMEAFFRCYGSLTALSGDHMKVPVEWQGEVVLLDGVPAVHPGAILRQPSWRESLFVEFPAKLQAHLVRYLTEAERLAIAS